jgi:hypothetical protein
MIEQQRVPFRLLQMECCWVMLCWINPRLPTYCPECGKLAYPQVKGWITATYDDAMLKYNVRNRPSNFNPNTTGVVC